MTTERAQRRLTTILAADVVGFSRLVRADEEATLRALAALRADIVDPAIAGHGGRIFKTTGDGVLAEFPSVVDAVRAAAQIQQAMAAFNAGRPAAARIYLRIGANLGDVVVQGEDLLGDGVNVAARLEGLAEPGGLCVSGSVHEQVRDRVAMRFQDMGAQTVRNIDRPVQAWRWTPEAVAAAAAPTVAERPSIAVLPFANMSGDPEQEYFADGMVEDILTGLSGLRWLTVIARNSSFAYKGRNPDIRQVGRELGVRYVLEGSVRRAGGAVRITAQLIEAESGGHLWADRFDGALADVFDLQDRITAGVIGAIEPSVRRAEIERARRKRPDSLDAWDLYLRALEQAYVFAPAARAAGLALLDKALALDPDYVEAHGVAAFLLQQRYLWGGRAQADRDEALRHAEAVARARTDDATSLAFGAMALSALAGRTEEAAVMVERALARNPSSAVAHTVSALIAMMQADPERSATHAERALRLSPFDPMRHTCEAFLAVAHLAAGRPEPALAHARRSVEANPGFPPGHATLALCLMALGRIGEARTAVAEVLRLAPDTRVANLPERYLPINGLGVARVAADLRAAGLPE